ncbi:beta-glucosidase [Acrasis kona]|uniref:Beta-glucosidase n=1 Tax=Acrasis kona TaxID=1008807 RepID=A0AAW2YMF5_9EUKA
MDDDNGIVFPKNFIFGAATASYQIEGGYDQDGRGKSIWDVFSHTPNKTKNGETGDVADDHYNKLEEDIALIKSLNLKHYRMSFSWSRILPDGTISNINKKGLNIITRKSTYCWLMASNQQLRCTIGICLKVLKINLVVVKAYSDYADLCFSIFGDRVKFWITFNEPWVTAVLGYLTGGNAPGRCTGCTPNGGDSSREPYIVAHNQLVSHAEAMNIYNTKYRNNQKGSIGITFNSDWFQAISDDPKDVEAAERHQQFFLGWYADPVFFGDYPQSMRDSCGDRLPQFTEQEKELFKATKSDFFGINHYTSTYVGAPRKEKVKENPTWYDDINVFTSYEKDGKLIGDKADSSWLYVVPWGCRKLMNWISKRYGSVPIYITENGVDAPGESDLSISQAVDDDFRLNYLKDYLKEFSNAVMIDKVNIKGYYVWSLMDNFEWADGYSKRFGITYVDYKSPDLKRTIKKSGRWYAEFIKNY